MCILGGANKESIYSDVFCSTNNYIKNQDDLYFKRSSINPASFGPLYGHSVARAGAAIEGEHYGESPSK